jgi:ABC-type polar amino acid transport system ATPase subunit
MKNRPFVVAAVCVSAAVFLFKTVEAFALETTGLFETVIASLPAQGTTVVMTTHDPDHPGRLNGESIFLEGGRHVLRSLR